MLKKDAALIVGGLSKPEKMPGGAINLPASACQTGSKLAKIPGTVCHNCYALKNRYVFKPVQDAMERRRKAIYKPEWVEAMVTLITGIPHFRWHDSGDIQCIQHFEKMMQVAEQTPETMHWCPTKEKKYLKYETPSNFVLRYSLTKINQERRPLDAGRLTSAVVTEVQDVPYMCQASVNKTSCDVENCRACWDPTIEHILYLEH